MFFSEGFEVLLGDRGDDGFVRYVFLVDFDEFVVEFLIKTAFRVCRLGGQRQHQSDAEDGCKSEC